MAVARASGARLLDRLIWFQRPMRAVSIGVSQNVRLDIHLQIAKEHDTVEVVAEAPLVENSIAVEWSYWCRRSRCR